MTIAILLLMLQSLAGPAANTKTANDIAVEILGVVDQEHPVFGSAAMDAAVLEDMAFHESSLGRFVIGDNGHAHCAYQLHGAPIRVLWDLHACTALAYERVRASALACPDAPLAVYVSGSCSNRTGRRISAHRMRQAARILEAVVPASVPAEQWPS